MSNFCWKTISLLGGACLLSSPLSAEPIELIEPTWESLATHYEVPEWFVDGKLGVWFHWGIPSSIKDGRPHDGSHYGAWMYGTDGQLSAAKHPEAVQRLTDWHDSTYGPHAEFGYEDLIPMFTADKWDPDALVKTVKDVGARFIMPVATHHDNFDMYDSSHPWNSVDMGPKRDTFERVESGCAEAWPQVRRFDAPVLVAAILQ